MKRTKIFACALALGLILAGCTALCFGAASIPEDTSNTAAAAQQSAPERVVLFDTSTLKITLDGSKTLIEDKLAQTVYKFGLTLKLRAGTSDLERQQARALGTTAADTDTLKITLAGRVIVVEDKTAQQTYCISR